ncbi:MAG: polysaccharide deacetylase family protein [Eubacteriales bacterium]|nr:polysaccharide deacetylase family protein [Eubacteriales bacterium]
MKKIIYFLVALMIVAALLPSSVIGAYADGRESWYVKRNCEHRQPSLDAEMKFIEGKNTYYVDKNHGDEANEKVIYLTFDAGYENGNIEKILNIMKEENVKGTFFILEHLISANTALVKRMADEGHVVANHTMNHKDMSTLSYDEFCKELSGLECLYREKIGAEMQKFYRPPQGVFNSQNLEWASALGYKTILWSFAYADWDNNKQPSEEKAMKLIRDNLHNGEIMLLHPTSDTNAKILQTLIRELKESGYSFYTVDRL